jgi:hypothetical protein
MDHPPLISHNPGEGRTKVLISDFARVEALPSAQWQVEFEQ